MTKYLTRLELMLLVCASLLVSCRTSDTASDTAPIAPTGKDFIEVNLDTSVKPGDDFFAYANGTWLRHHSIPASESTWGIGNVVQEELYANLRGINEHAATNSNPAGSDLKKIGDFWLAATDPAKADQQGVAPLKPYLDKIDAAATKQ